MTKTNVNVIRSRLDFCMQKQYIVLKKNLMLGNSVTDDVEKIQESKSIEIKSKNSSSKKSVKNVEKYFDPHSRISPIFENVLEKRDDRFYLLGKQKDITILGIY